MFDNLFGLAGTVGTSAVLFLMLVTAMATALVSRAKLPARSGVRI
jgi:hypothetical protein